MASVTTSPDEPFVRSGVSWAEYVAFCDSLGERRVRVTYDRGEMEFMTVSALHQGIKRIIALLLGVIIEELDIKIVGYGNLTMRREDIERGLEPVDCYWLTHAEQMRGRREIDFRTDPPPDLVVEIEISRTALNRLGIYAALGVPEVWRCDNQRLRVCVRGDDPRYTEVPSSLRFSLPANGRVPSLCPGRRDRDRQCACCAPSAPGCANRSRQAGRPTTDSSGPAVAGCGKMRHLDWRQDADRKTFTDEDAVFGLRAAHGHCCSR